jgi:hypothetical protein
MRPMQQIEIRAFVTPMTVCLDHPLTASPMQEFM